jgi:hypothetical protein
MADIEVVLDDIKQHESHVRELTEKINTAAQAAESAQALGDVAFGLVGQVIAVVVQGWATQATETVTVAGQVSEGIANALKDTHTCYVDNEAANTQSFGKISEALA